jgi:hypothetical protein
MRGAGVCSGFMALILLIENVSALTLTCASRRTVGCSLVAALAANCIDTRSAWSAQPVRNEAEEKLAARLAEKVAAREKMMGYTLDADDIQPIEEMLRNKYCGPQGLYSGEAGGTCAENAILLETCGKAVSRQFGCIEEKQASRPS